MSETSLQSAKKRKLTERPTMEFANEIIDQSGREFWNGPVHLEFWNNPNNLGVVELSSPSKSFGIVQSIL